MKRFAIARLFFASLIIFPFCPVFTNAQEFELKSEKHIDIEKEHTKITIRCNASDAAVYLNGEYQGLTTLTINDLKPGRYTLRIEKKGYESKKFFINVHEARSETWYVELKKNTGFVSFSVEPAGSTISIDGNSANEQMNEVEEGTHTVLVKKFGYNAETRTIAVFRHTFQELSISLEQAVFSASDLQSSKKSFNSLNSSSLGKTTFSFSVTNHGSGTLTIKDSMGNFICNYNFADFTTWDQTAAWDGKDNTGKRVPDGTYTATLNVSGTEKDTANVSPYATELSVSVIVDSTIRYPVASITSGGLGIGILPAAFASPQGSMMIGASAGAIFNSDGTPFYAAPFSLSFSGTPAKWLEYSFKASLLAGIEDTPLTASGSIKFSHSKMIDGGISAGGANLECAMIIKLGFSSHAVYEPYGADTGNGLGAGMLIGFETLHFYTGLSTIYTFGPVTGNLKGTDSVWQNGLCIQYRDGNTGLGLFGALNSCFGKAADETEDREGQTWARAIQAGIDFTSLITDSDVAVSVKPGILLYTTGKLYPYGEISFSILY